MLDNNKIKMTRKPGKKHKENPVRCTGKVKDEKEIKEKGQEVFSWCLGVEIVDEVNINFIV